MNLNTLRLAPPLDIRAAWQALTTAVRLRNRDAAHALGISEAELIASAIGNGVRRLDGDFRDIIRRVPELGPVTALTRNDACVHEKAGVYGHVSANAVVGVVRGDDIDLRLRFLHWSLAYAVEEDMPEGTAEGTFYGTRQSLQFFDACGTAVHKIYLTPASSPAAYTRLIHAYASANQLRAEAVLPPPGRETARPDKAIDVAGLRAGWAALCDTHEFARLLKRFDAAPTQALRLAGRDLARAVPNHAVAAVLDAAAQKNVAITVHTGNRGCRQIHSGHICHIRGEHDRVHAAGGWLSVLDPGFNLHLDTGRIAECWVVTLPTGDGPVNLLEVFDEHGEAIVTVGGARGAGEGESPRWRALLEGLSGVG